MKKVILVALILVWMISIYMFSNQPAEISGNMSNGITENFLEKIGILSGKTIDEKEKLISSVDGIVRKLAHLTLYSIGGILVFLLFHEYKISTIKQFTFALLIGFAYAVTDEIHQLFIPRKSMYVARYINRYNWFCDWYLYNIFCNKNIKNKK